MKLVSKFVVDGMEDLIVASFILIFLMLILKLRLEYLGAYFFF